MTKINRVHTYKRLRRKRQRIIFHYINNIFILNLRFKVIVIWCVTGVVLEIHDRKETSACPQARSDGHQPPIEGIQSARVVIS